MNSWTTPMSPHWQRRLIRLLACHRGLDCRVFFIIIIVVVVIVISRFPQTYWHNLCYTSNFRGYHMIIPIARQAFVRASLARVSQISHVSFGLKLPRELLWLRNLHTETPASICLKMGNTMKYLNLWPFWDWKLSCTPWDLGVPNFQTQ